MGYAAAAPLFMAGMQFAMQHMLARLVFSTGLIKRTADNLSWQEWLKCGKDKGVRGWKMVEGNGQNVSPKYVRDKAEARDCRCYPRHRPCCC